MHWNQEYKIRIWVMYFLVRLIRKDILVGHIFFCSSCNAVYYCLYIYMLKPVERKVEEVKFMGRIGRN